MGDEGNVDTPMWKFQGWFHYGTVEAAKEVFDRLDYKLRSRDHLGGWPSGIRIKPMKSYVMMSVKSV